MFKAHGGISFHDYNITRGDAIRSVQTKIFKSNRSQAVRLPKEVAFPESVKDVEILVEGNKRIIVSADQSWDDWFDAPGVSNDFMNERMQPDDQIRDML
ncbi:MAG: type II toxin-antitoxin system VapB family antitoxin [Desulfovermiculus sp.]|nr:type II toxin-antitoxin system VapB family antitoxin [Desulfovermiculus sp.]